MAELQIVGAGQPLAKPGELSVVSFCERRIACSPGSVAPRPDLHDEAFDLLDELGQRLASELASKARSGVPVYFLYDEIGSFGLPGSTGLRRRLAVGDGPYA